MHSILVYSGTQKCNRIEVRTLLKSEVCNGSILEGKANMYVFWALFFWGGGDGNKIKNEYVNECPENLGAGRQIALHISAILAH
jgi:hypothetical protein